MNKLSHFLRRSLLMEKKRSLFQIMMRKMIMKIQIKRIRMLAIWLLRLRALKDRRKRGNFKKCPILKVCMLKLSKKSSSSIRNLQPTTTIEDGYGCNSHGSAWRWNAIILTNSENVLLLLHHICLFPRKDNSPYVEFIYTLEALKIALEAKKKKQAILEKTE